ncbi:MAG: nucleotide exchange factor GrpE [Minisyncoccota bacterium]
MAKNKHHPDDEFEISHEEIMPRPKKQSTEDLRADENTIATGETTIDWQEKATEYLEDWKRTQAEFENYKKRQAVSQKELTGYLIEKLVLDIVPVLDNFRSATLHVPAEQKESPWVIGIQYIEKQLESVLTDHGVETIEVQPGEAFDPNIHEAISSERVEHVPSAITEPQDMVTKVLQRGYRFGTRVIRPAKVIVSERSGKIV